MKTAIKLNQSTREAITTYAASENRTDKAREKALKALQANGITAAMLDLKAKEHGALHADIKAAIVASWPPTKEALLDANVKKLNKGQKATRRALQQQLGSRYSKLVSTLRKLENPAPTKTDKASETDKASKASEKSTEVQILEAMTKAIKLVQDSDELSFNAVQFVKHVNAALEVIAKSAK